jgi:hypothetical protein
VPTITDLGDRLEFRGEIRRVGLNDNGGLHKGKINGVGEFLLFILILPMLLAVRVYLFVEWLVRKIFNRPKPKEKTNEERLFELMVNYFGCVVIGEGIGKKQIVNDT